jgi:predicted SAM-dependent methyltransferase
VRLNIGCGDWPLPGWTNLDARAKCKPDVLAKVPPLPFADESVEEIYAGHFVEHLTPKDADKFLAECYRVLVPGGRLGVVVPDTKMIARAYVEGHGSVEYPEGTVRPMADLDEICDLFLYSTAQESPHRWSYDADTLRRLLLRAGFYPTTEIDRYADPRIPVKNWYSCGWDAVKPGGAR